MLEKCFRWEMSILDEHTPMMLPNALIFDDTEEFECLNLKERHYLLWLSPRLFWLTDNLLALFITLCIWRFTCSYNGFPIQQTTRWSVFLENNDFFFFFCVYYTAFCRKLFCFVFSMLLLSLGKRKPAHVSNYSEKFVKEFFRMLFIIYCPHKIIRQRFWLKYSTEKMTHLFEDKGILKRNFS